MFTLLYNMTIGIQGRQRGIYLNFTVHYYTSQQLISLHSFFLVQYIDSQHSSTFARSQFVDITLE